MKAEMIANHMWITGETDGEINFLQVLSENGARVFGRSSTGISITSPHLAELRQLHVNREQQAILCYALGLIEFQEIAKQMITLGAGDTSTMLKMQKIQRDIADLKNQLFIAPDKVYPKGKPVATAPTRTPIKTQVVKPEKEKTN